MEAFEQFVALALEHEGFIVAGGLKFPVRRKTAKSAYDEWQTHGFEVDLVAARQDRLVLATVKSFFGSRGVVSEHVTGATQDRWARLYALLNDRDVRDTVVDLAADRFGYEPDQVEVRLYAGRFAGGRHEDEVRAWCATQSVGSGPIAVIGAEDVVSRVRELAASGTYRDNAVLATLKVLDAVDSR